MIDSYSDFVIHTRSGFCSCHELLSEHVSFRSRKIKTVSLFNRRDIVCCLRNNVNFLEISGYVATESGIDVATGENLTSDQRAEFMDIAKQFQSRLSEQSRGIT